MLPTAVVAPLTFSQLMLAMLPPKDALPEIFKVLPAPATLDCKPVITVAPNNVVSKPSVIAPA